MATTQAGVQLEIKRLIEKITRIETRITELNAEIMVAELEEEELQFVRLKEERLNHEMVSRLFNAQKQDREVKLEDLKNRVTSTE